MNILIFDPDRGTFVVTILIVHDGFFVALSTNGDTRLGGKDLVLWILEQFIKLIKKKHALPSRYACAFASANSDSRGSLQEDALKCMKEFIKDYGKEACGNQISSLGWG